MCQARPLHTETLLAAYATWGRDMLARLKGMFAFAIYDTSRRELFVARDRLGIRSLYYVVVREGIQLRAGFANNRLHWTRLWAIVVLGHFAKRRQLSMHEDSPLHSLA
jgi:hypothetical protein